MWRIKVDVSDSEHMIHPSLNHTDTNTNKPSPGVFSVSTRWALGRSPSSVFLYGAPLSVRSRRRCIRVTITGADALSQSHFGLKPTPYATRAGSEREELGYKWSRLFVHLSLFLWFCGFIDYRIWSFALNTCSALHKERHRSFSSFHFMSCSTSLFQTELPLRFLLFSLFFFFFCTPVSRCPTSYFLFWSWWSLCAKVTVVRQPPGISRHPELRAAMNKCPSASDVSFPPSALLFFPVLFVFFVFSLTFFKSKVSFHLKSCWIKSSYFIFGTHFEYAPWHGTFNILYLCV